MAWIYTCFLFLGTCLILVVDSAESEPTLYWTVNEVNGDRSCLYSIEGTPSSWVQALTLGGEVIAEPLCVNKTIFKFGSLSADIQSTRDVITFDLLGGGLTRFHAMHDGNVESFFMGATDLQDVAVDWVNHNVYYTDPTTGIVIVSYKDGAGHFRILSDEVAVPRGIALDTNRGYLFWADSGSGTIQLLPLGGGEGSPVVEGLSVPTLVAVDGAARTVYWLDEGVGEIGAWAYNSSTSEPRTVVSSDDILPGIFSGLEVYGEYIFGLVSDEATVVIWDRNTGELVTTLNFDDVSDVTQHGISMAISPPQANSNPCDIDNGACDHICVHEGRGDTRVCLCSLGYQLQQDGSSCVSTPVVDDFMLLTDMGVNRLYQLSLGDGTVHALPINRTWNQRLEDVTYDPRDQAVYWVDTGNNTLRRVMLQGGTEEVVHMFEEGSLVEGLAFDMVGRNIYYTDVGRFNIGRVSLQTGRQTTVLTMSTDDYPLKIQLDPHNGFMYWSNIGFPSAKIERARMSDGGGRRTIVGDLEVPSALVISLKDGKLFWNDERLERLEMSSLDGSDRRQIASVSGLYNLAMGPQYLYAIFSHEVTRYSIEDQTSWPLGPRIFSNIYGAHLYSSNLQPVSTTTEIIISGAHRLTWTAAIVAIAVLHMMYGAVMTR